MDAHTNDNETVGAQQLTSRLNTTRRFAGAVPLACRARNRPRRVRSCSRLNYPSLCCAPIRLSRRRWSVIGGVFVAAVFIAVAVHAHSSRADSVLSAVTPAKGEASQLFRGSE